jgi:putative ATPase
MRNLGYGKGYRYAHSYPQAYTSQEYLPDKLRGRIYYHPTDRGFEKTIGSRLLAWRKLKEKKRE